MFSQIRGLLFDKDGTLLDFDRTWRPINLAVATYAANGDLAARDHLLAACGYDQLTGVTRSGSIFAAAGHAETVAFITDQMHGHVPADLAEAVARIYTEGGAKHATALPGVADTLQALAAKGLVLGVATNDTAAGLEASLTTVGLLASFGFKAGCDSGYGAKPDPAVIHAFCRANGLALDQVAMVGDSAHDMEAARHAGRVLRVAVLSGTGTAADLTPLADVVLDSVTDLIAALAGER
jgi:phosphoglycolate phosphatase